MNEKFWDLKKEKQDNMIGGALKVFARDGFRHASTDEIVSEASVSKGLLFHYFYSKVGLYEFLSEYCARFALVELSSELRKADVLPFFELQYRITKAEARMMRQYPYLLLFLERAARDTDSGITQDVVSNTQIYTERLGRLKADAVCPEGMTREDADRIDHLLRLLRSDTAVSLLCSGSFAPDKYTAIVSEAISFFEKIFT